jgi:hypothetical protein
MSKVTEYLRGHLLGEVSVRQEDCKLASSDNGILEQLPEMVIYPFNTNDIRKIVRVLFDAWGSRKFPNFHKMMRRMTEKGIAWHKILPVRFSLCQRQKEMPSYSLFLVAQTIPTKTTSASLTRLFNLLDIVLLLRTHILFPMNRYSVRLFQPHSEVFGSRF